MSVPPLDVLRRVAVVGTSCSGKTTFARRLAESVGARHVEMDALYWLPGWTVRPEGEFRDLLAEAVAADRWTLCGNYGSTRDVVWPRATAIVWLDDPFAVVARRALARTCRRVFTRQELFAGNRETFRLAFLSRDSILWWVAKTHRRRRREYSRLFEEIGPNGPAVVILRSPAEADRFLATIAEASRDGAGSGEDGADPSPAGSETNVIETSGGNPRTAASRSAFGRASGRPNPPGDPRRPA